jgi:hypothetical protein
MVNINKMARAAGIGSAVGAVGGIIKTANDSEPDTSSNILGGIVGGALVGSVGGAGISAPRQYLQAKRLANAAGSDIVEAAAKQASKAQKSTQSSVINNAQDLDIAKQVSKATAGNTAPIQTKPVHVNSTQINSTQNGTIEKLIDDYYGPGTSADEYVRNKLNKSFTETKRFRKWHIGDPYSDGEIGTDLEIRQRKSNGVFEIKEHSFFADDPEYYSKPSEWMPYKFN